LLNRITGHSVMGGVLTRDSGGELRQVAHRGRRAMETLTRTPASKHDDSNRAQRLPRSLQTIAI
jgi:hypothetical protein